MFNKNLKNSEKKKQEKGGRLLNVKHLAVGGGCSFISQLSKPERITQKLH